MSFEAVHDPPMLMFDEPTFSLDGALALRMVSNLNPCDAACPGARIKGEGVQVASTLARAGP